MVGLSIVLETCKKNGEEVKNRPQVINKATMFKLCPVSVSSERVTPVAGFLERCFLCYRKLLEGKDIYMYKGDRAFCSVECRDNQILMDEGEISNTANACFERERCSVAAIKGTISRSQSSSLSSSSSRNDQKDASNKNGAKCFVY